MQVICERIVIVANCRSARLAKSPPVVCNHPASGFQQCKSLLLPRRAVERPAVNQNYWLSGPMVVVVEFYFSRVFLTHIDEGHFSKTCLWVKKLAYFSVQE